MVYASLDESLKSFAIEMARTPPRLADAECRLTIDADWKGERALIRLSIVRVDVQFWVLGAGYGNQAVVVSGCGDRACASERGAWMDIDPAKGGHCSVIDGKNRMRGQADFIAPGEVDFWTEHERLFCFFRCVPSDFKTEEFQAGIRANCVGGVS